MRTFILIVLFVTSRALGLLDIAQNVCDFSDRGLKCYMCLPNILKLLSLAFVGPICANLCLWPLLTSSTVRAFLQFSAFGEIGNWTAP